MSTRGILMSEISVLALLEGRKTETRRLKSREKPGDTLYVREAWKAAYRRRSDDALQVIYRADGRQAYLPVPPDKIVRLRRAWRLGRFMFRFMARDWLRVEAVTPQMLHDIDAAAAIREGIFNCEGLWYYVGGGIGYPDPVTAYANWWDALHGADPAVEWAANPGVYAVRYQVLRDDPYNLISEPPILGED